MIRVTDTEKSTEIVFWNRGVEFNSTQDNGLSVVFRATMGTTVFLSLATVRNRSNNLIVENIAVDIS